MINYNKVIKSSWTKILQKVLLKYFGHQKPFVTFETLLDNPKSLEVGSHTRVLGLLYNSGPSNSRTCMFLLRQVFLISRRCGAASSLNYLLQKVHYGDRDDAHIEFTPRPRRGGYPRYEQLQPRHLHTYQL